MWKCKVFTSKCRQPSFNSRALRAWRPRFRALQFPFGDLLAAGRQGRQTLPAKDVRVNISEMCRL